MDVKQIFATALRVFREQRGLSQAELARSSNLSPAAISLPEKGDREPSLSTALAISDALNMSVYALVNRVEYPDNEATVRIELTKSRQKLAKIQMMSKP